MEEIILGLMAPDNEIIKKATSDLQEAFKNPESTKILCDITVGSTNPAIRQYSAILLRKRFIKLRIWQTVPLLDQELIKTGMLSALLVEPEKSVRNNIAQFIGVLIKHEFNKQDQWMHNVLKYIYDSCTSSDPTLSEIGSSVFSIFTEVAYDQFVPHLLGLCDMFSTTLLTYEANGNMVVPVILNIMIGMSNLIPYVIGNVMAENTYQKAVPYIIKALQGFAVQQPDEFVKGFIIIETLLEFMPKLLTVHVKLLLEFCLEASRNVQLKDNVRIRTVQFIGELVRLKKKSILKQKLLEPIIQIVFNLMATNQDGDDNNDDEEYFVGSDDNTTPKTAATQTMDLLALNIPPEKLIPPLLTLLEPALKGDNSLYKKGAYLCIAVIAEGCSEAICAKYLRPLLDCVKMGIVNEHVMVRNAAFFALGQFAEHLQPEITKYANEILPILFTYLQHLTTDIQNNVTEPKHITRMFYALETFIENLDDIAQYLPTLMERLFEILDTKNSVRLRELALSCVSSTATAAKQLMLPYFQQLIENLKIYLIISDDEDICTLRPAAIDALASIARTIGTENFAPLSQDTLKFALTLLETVDDPELRTCLYNLIAALAEVLHGGIGLYLPKIISRMIDTIQNSDEVVPEYKDGSVIDVFANLTEEDDNDDINDDDIDIEHSLNEADGDDDVAGFSVENAYLDEKEEAILAIKQIAEHTGTIFAPYIDSSFQAIYKQIDHPQDDIRKVAIEALTQLTVILNNLCVDKTSVINAVNILIPKIAEIIKTDEQCLVVIAAMDAYAQLFSNLKNHITFDDKLKEIVFECIQMVLNSKVICQFDECPGGHDDDEHDESEYDDALIELTGDLVPKFGAAITPTEFATFFERLCPIFIQKINKIKNNVDLSSQRSFAYGAISECFKPLQEYTGKWFHILLPMYLNGLQDKCEQVRHNTVFGLGELVLYSGEKAYGNYPEILQALSNAVSTEQHPGTLDNICGALARLIIANYKLIPLEQVLPVYVSKLPLREDFDENSSVFKSFNILFNDGVESLLQVLDKIIYIGLCVLYKKEYKDEDDQQFITNFLKNVRNRFEDKFHAVANSEQEIAEFVKTL